MRRPVVVGVAGPAGCLLASGVLSLALGAQVAGATSQPPNAYTGEAAQLTTSSATLNGSVDPRGQSTSYYFQYGATAAYEGQTPVAPAGGASQSIHVSASVSGLAAHGTYHYRLAAVNPAGTTYGQDRTFTTKKVPLTLGIASRSGRDLFGRAFSVSGTLLGTESAGHPVVIQANPFPYLGGFKDVGVAEVTDANGYYSFLLAGWPQNTQLRVATLDVPPVTSPVMVELVAVRVSLHLRPTGRRGFARLYGSVTPAEQGARVAFQLLRPGRRPLNVGGTSLTGGSTTSRFSSVLRIRSAGLYRAFVEVVSGAQVSNHSRAILIG